MFGDIYEETDRNRIMGVALEESLEFPLFYDGALQVDYQGVSPAPVKAVITAKQNNATPN